MTDPWRRRADRPLVIAHRGASRAFPENTMAAFRAAREQGADGVELDVQPCATGELVVFHDDDLTRLTGQPFRVIDTSLSALRRLHIAGEPIPTLLEVMEELAPTDMRVNIELKTSAHTRRIAPLGLARELAAQPLGERALVSSFDPVALALFARRARHVSLGLLFHGELARPLREAWPARWLRPMALHPERRLVRPDAVARWRAAGYGINTWTVDKPRDWARFGDLVDAVITNTPAEAIAHYG